MRDPLTKKVMDIAPSGIRKFFDIVSEMDNVISLGVGEPDFDTPWHIRDEGIYSLEKGRTFYTSNAGLKVSFHTRMEREGAGRWTCMDASIHIKERSFVISSPSSF